MKLSRDAAGLTQLPVRIVHLGVGAFARAHSIWFTQSVDQQREWGVAAFTGRSPRVAEQLTAQDSLYTLITRGPHDDSFELISQIAKSHDINEIDALDSYLTDPNVHIVTLTITEAGYTIDHDGILTRLSAALAKRADAHSGPLTIISCDNITNNGERTRALLLAAAASENHRKYLEEQVGFISTSVDRITPKSTPADIETVRIKTGWEDCTPVVTEPFSNWVLAGKFATPRPAWEAAGAQFVDEITLYENRKLWLLNGSHSYLAYRGLNAGYTTVAQAIVDPAIRAEVDDLWDIAAHSLGLDVNAYRNDVIERYENSRIEHQLSQIAIDGSLKLAMRTSTVILDHLKRGLLPTTYVRLFAEWITYVQSHEFIDANSQQIENAQTTEDFLAIVSPDFIQYPIFIQAISESIEHAYAKGSN